MNFAEAHMGRKAGCGFQISIINEETNNTFVPLTVNLPEGCQLSAGDPTEHSNFLSHINSCALP